jgi:hypothetical protein
MNVQTVRSRHTGGRTVIRDGDRAMNLCERKHARLPQIMVSRTNPFSPTDESRQFSIRGKIPTFKPLCVLYSRELRSRGQTTPYLVPNDSCHVTAVTREHAAEHIEPVGFRERAEHHRVEDKPSP